MIGMSAALLAQAVAPERVEPQQRPAPRQPQLAVARNLHADLNSALKSDQVPQMGLAWKIETEDNVSHMPLVEGNHLYFADWGGTV